MGSYLSPDEDISCRDGRLQESDFDTCEGWNPAAGLILHKTGAYPRAVREQISTVGGSRSADLHTIVLRDDGKSEFVC